MTGHWIKLHRKMLNSPIMRHDGLFRLWAYCLLVANWKPSKWLVPGTLREVQIGRGQFITGRTSLHEALYPKRDRDGRIIECEYTPAPRTLWRRLEALRIMGCVKLQNLSNRCTLVTVCNYETYQDGGHLDCPADVPLMSRCCPADVPLMSTTEEDKKIRKEEDKTEDVCTETSDDVVRAADPPPVALLTFPCDGKVKQWHLTESHVAEWAAAFPSLDVLGECKKALAWSNANPTKRKTAGGMPKFLFSWLGRAQDSPRRAAIPTTNGSAGRKELLQNLLGDL